MLEKSAQLIAEIQSDLISQYPFLSQWQISFDSAKKRAGICRISSKEISFSICHIESNEIDVVKDTVLHEFAHAIAYELYVESGHGRAWKQIARQIGAIPKAKGSFNLPEAPWVLVHSCSKTSDIRAISERFRRNKKIKNYFLVGKPETKGELFFIKQADYIQFKQGLLEKSRLLLVQ